MSVDVECVVIGAGVVGLAIAAKLAQLGKEVLILDAQSSFGTVTSALNSEVIHAGIYYQKNSLKALYCVDGKHKLYAYCEQRNIPFRQCEKLIVATDNAQCDQLEQIRQRAAINGVVDLKSLSAHQVQRLEPGLSCSGALLSPSTGIIDSHSYMLSLLADAQCHGAVLATHSRVDGIAFDHRRRHYALDIHAGEPLCLNTRQLVNAAGHGACALFQSLEHRLRVPSLQAVMYKGNYFALSARSPFSRLIYPVPEAAGLGVHLTLDLADAAHFGPDVEPVDDENYDVDPMRANHFYTAIRKYWPALPDNTLRADYAGIRPRVVVDGQLYADFLFMSEKEHGLPGLVHCLGIESPGLTASLAIADAVGEMLAYPVVA